MTANLNAASISAAVNTAAREARQANGDFGSIWTERDWARMGSEVEAEDRAKGFAARGTDLSDTELRDVLSDFYAADLANREICENPEEALDALVDGYRKGA